MKGFIPDLHAFLPTNRKYIVKSKIVCKFALEKAESL